MINLSRSLDRILIFIRIDGTMDRRLEYCVFAAIIALLVLTSWHQMLPIK